MSEIDVTRALKDKDYYNSLSAEQKKQVPANPAGSVELSDDALDSVAGGMAEQTGTGSATCECMLTRTAVSGGGHCDCHCDATLDA